MARAGEREEARKREALPIDGKPRRGSRRGLGRIIKRNGRASDDRFALFFFLPLPLPFFPFSIPSPSPPSFLFFFVIFRRHAVGNTAACNTVKWIFRLTSRDRDRPTHHHHHHHRRYHHRCPAKNSNALQKFIEVTDLSNPARLLKHRVDGWMPRFLVSSRDSLSLSPRLRSSLATMLVPNERRSPRSSRAVTRDPFRVTSSSSSSSSPLRVINETVINLRT